MASQTSLQKYDSNRPRLWGRVHKAARCISKVKIAEFLTGSMGAALLIVTMASCRAPQSDQVALGGTVERAFPGPGELGPGGLDGFMGCEVLVNENLFGANQDSMLQFEAMAVFADDGEARASQHIVSLEGHTITSETERVYRSESPQRFDGMQRWIAADEEGSVILSDSILAPNIFRITYPRPISDTISRSVGFRCSWNDPGTDSVKLKIMYDSVVTDSFFDPPLFHAAVPAIRMSAANTGSFFVRKELLTRFPAGGVIQVWVTAGRRKTVTVSGKDYKMASVCRARTYCFVQQ